MAMTPDDCLKALHTIGDILERLNSRVYMLEADDEGRGYDNGLTEMIEELRDQLPPKPV